MLPVAQKTKRQGLTLKGSAILVTDYLSFVVNTVLFQRDVYEPQEFEMVKKYGLSLMMMKNNNFLRNILMDVETALSQNKLYKVILALFNKHSDTVIEKWEFDIREDDKQSNCSQGIAPTNISLIQAEIRTVMKQILGSVSFMPITESGSTFDIFLRLEQGFELPGWTTYRGSLDINNSEEFVFKHFSTSMHECNTKVMYRR